VIYRGGPRAAIARAETLIPDVQTRLLAGAGHALTLDCPDELADAMVNVLV
jgi:pimeloyl-ACP methyl ester carboxylesterase